MWRPSVRWIVAGFEMGDSSRQGNRGLIHAITAIQEVFLNTRASFAVAQRVCDLPRGPLVVLVVVVVVIIVVVVVLLTTY